MIRKSSPVAGRGRKRAAKVVARRKRAMTEEQRKAVAERMRKDRASRGAVKAEDTYARVMRCLLDQSVLGTTRTKTRALGTDPTAIPILRSSIGCSPG